MKGKRCLVVGAGNVGSRKIVNLVGAEVEVTAVSPDASTRVRELAAAGRICWKERFYRMSDLEATFLVVAATSNASLNGVIGHQAAERGILCCVASSADQSNAIFPAIVTGDSVSVAVHTDGRDCRRARRIRDLIGKYLHSLGWLPKHDRIATDRTGNRLPSDGVLGPRKNGLN